MILVTGATGILGRIIVLELLKQGYSVRATKRSSSNLEEVKNSYRFYTDHSDVLFKKIEWIDVDFSDLSSVEKSLEGVVEVYHCSAKVSFHPKDREEMFATNIEGTQNLLYACQNSTVQKFLFVSSIAVLDGVNEDGVLDESCFFNTEIDHSDYAISKQLSELEVWRSSAEGLNVIIINPGVIIGSGNWNSSSGTLFKSIAQFPFSFSGGTAYVDVRDVAAISIELMKKNLFGEKYLITAENLRYIYVAKMVRERLNLSAPKILSTTVLNWAYGLNVVFGWLIPAFRMLTKSNIKAITEQTIISNDKVKKELNYSFIPIRESLEFHLKNYIKDRK